ncbi:Uncharacterized protein TPAR_08012 [Tolypocladium paradoxum]|uniref:Uncharacterized protein n=1 Tax=Tolypocladium paradoxum TaxID=94208 RepID=A0A2S4KNN5_9HYPO|nr:Uncharacterized protein TPAR_08012 [Tolypocladium paradoxum]
MRGSVPLVAALSAYLSAAVALPQWGLLPRAASSDNQKPNYSVVPLEPGDDQPGNGGRGGGYGATDVAVVTQTITKTAEPSIITKTAEPKTITKTAEPNTITKFISVIDISGDGATTIAVTPAPAPARTVTVHQSSPVTTSSPPPRSSTSAKETTRTTTILPSGGVPSTNSTLSIMPTTTVPSTFSTITTTPQTSSSRTYDDGLWRTTYPPWNGTMAYRYKR